MKVGVLQFFGWPERRTALSTVYARAIERIQLMDRTGYDAVWLAEHHFTGYSVCPSVHMMGVHAANHTTRIRIGMGVSLAAFYHPLRLAEEVALLDVLSGGRVSWGAGRGFDPIEFAAFGVPVQESGERFHEAVEIVRAAWTQTRLTWSGKYWKFENIEVLPKPLQQPHPPIWLAAGSPGAVRWAGKHGYSILLGPHSTFDENRAHHQLYCEQLREHGHSSQGREIPMARFIAVAETDVRAAELARSGVEWVAGSYINPSKTTSPSAQAQDFLRMDRSALIQRYLDEVVIHGSVDSVLEQIARYRQEAQLNYLMCVPLSHSSFLHFTDKVLPRIG